MEVQQEIAFERAAAQVGRRLDVILDVPVPEEQNVWIGRTYADAPDVDAVVFVTGGNTKLAAGTIISCEIAATSDYDLAGIAAGKAR